MFQDRYTKLYNGYDFPLLGLGIYSQSPEESWINSIKDAIDIGYRHFDCASFYGNEKEIGIAINEKIAETVVQREDIFVTSKLWNNKHEKDSVLPALENTLADLGLEYVDLYLIHWPFSVPDIPGEGIPKDENGKVLTTNVNYKVTWKAMEACVEKGLTRSIGLSNFNIHQIKDIMKRAKIKPAVLQIESHPYLAQRKVIDFCKAMDIVVTVYCPLGKPISSFRGVTLLEDSVLKIVAKKYNKTPPQIAIRYQIERGVGVILKTTKKSSLAENFDVFDFSMRKKDVLILESLDKDERYVKFSEYADHKFYPFHEEPEEVEESTTEPPKAVDS